MTPQDYKNKGFELSLNLNQSVIDRAESDVIRSYVTPILPTYQSSDEDVKSCIMNFAFLLILQRTTVKATRAGAKEKNDAYGITASTENRLQECALSAHSSLEVLRKKEGANAKAEIYDICGVYFQTNFIGV